MKLDTSDTESMAQSQWLTPATSSDPYKLERRFEPAVFNDVGSKVRSNPTIEELAKAARDEINKTTTAGS